MGWLTIVTILIFTISHVRAADSMEKFIKDFCNPVNQNNERIPRNGIFQPPNINCPTYAIVCQSNGLGFFDYCPSGQVFYNGACTPAPRQCGGSDEIDCRNFPGRQMIAKGCSAEFYWCHEGRMTKHTCQANRYFNPKNGQCDFFENVELCNGPAKDQLTTTTQKTYVPAEIHPIDCTAKPDGDYADPSNVCSQRYYTCANGITFRRDCNSGLYFDPDQMNCQRYENVRLCGGQPLQTAQSAADIICSKVTGNIVDPDSDGCSRNFYACNGGKAIKTKCADPGHAFNAKTDRCEVKKTIEGCDPGYCEGKENGRYEAPGSNGCSSSFLHCSNERSYIQPCPATLIYNKRTKRCEWPYDVEECGEPSLDYGAIPFEQELLAQYPTKTVQQLPPPAQPAPQPQSYVPQPSQPVVEYNRPEPEPESPREPVTVKYQATESPKQPAQYIQPAPQSFPPQPNQSVVYESKPQRYQQQGPTPAPYQANPTPKPLLPYVEPLPQVLPPNPIQPEQTPAPVLYQATESPLPVQQYVQNWYQPSQPQPNQPIFGYRVPEQPVTTIQPNESPQSMQQYYRLPLQTMPPPQPNSPGFLYRRPEQQQEQQPGQYQTYQSVQTVQQYPPQPLPPQQNVPENNQPEKQQSYLPPQQKFPVNNQPGQQQSFPIAYNSGATTQQPLQPAPQQPQQYIQPVPQTLPAQESRAAFTYDDINRLCFGRSPPRSDLVFPPYAPTYPGSTCGSEEMFVECPNSCEFTCPRKYAGDCSLPKPCAPSCRCKKGYSRRLSDNRCIKSNVCYSSHSYEDDSRSHDEDDINDDADRFFCGDREDGNYPMPGDICSTELYYKCRHSRVDFWRCSKGKIFDSNKRRCTRRSRNCWETVTTLDKFFCQGKLDKAYNFPFPECSKKYYTCNSGVPQIKTCDDGFVYSEKHGCVHPRKCRRIRRHDNDPDHWFCAGKIDHGFSFPKETCSTRYYQCRDNLAAFRLCPHDHVFDGFSCVPKPHCIDVDGREDTLDKSVYETASLIINANKCLNLPSYSFIVARETCEPEFAICINNTTTFHKCGCKQVFTYVDNFPDTVIDCKVLTGCKNISTKHQLRNYDFPEADDFCDYHAPGFYQEKECGQRYGFCYCSKANVSQSQCQPKLVRLTCPSPRHVFDKKANQCVLRSKIETCKKDFDVKEFCHDRRPGKYELMPCISKYVDCEDKEVKHCPGDLLFSKKRGCGRHERCHRKPLVYDEDKYYPGPEDYPEFEFDFTFPREAAYPEPPYPQSFLETVYRPRSSDS